MNRALGMIGLAARARKLAAGEDLCVKSIRSGSAKAVLLDAGAGPNTTKSVADACRYYDVPLVKLPEGELGRAIGRSGRMTAAVLDGGMAKRILELVETSDVSGE